MLFFRSARFFAALLTLSASSVLAQSATQCDVDIDSDIDRDDIALIMAARNHSSSGTDDPRDADANGIINVNDARICTLRCSLAQCAPESPNGAPVANAGADQSVFPGATVTLDGTGSSDPDGDALTFSWTLRERPAGSAAVLDDATVVSPQFVADFDGRYEIDLIVNDGRVDSAVDSIVIATIPENTAPVANAGLDVEADVGNTVVLDGSLSSDVDGDALSFAWTLSSQPVGSGAVLSDANSAQASFVPDVSGTYIAELSVNDGRGGRSSDTVEIRTIAANRAPVANAGPDQAIAAGQLVTLDGSGSSDADGDPLGYGWSFLVRPDGSTATLDDASSVTPTFRLDVAGEFVVQLIVNDGALNSVADTVLITSNNTPPVANAGANAIATVGDTTTFDGTGSSDADGDALSFFWSVVYRPDESTARLTNELTPTPSFAPDVQGFYIIQLIVNDGTVDSAPDTLEFEVRANHPPSTRVDSQEVPFETAVLIDVLANDFDGDGDPLTLDSLTAPVSGTATIDGQRVRYTPAADYSGPDYFRYVVSDSRGGSATGLVLISVLPPPGTVTVVVTDDVARELGPDSGAFTFYRSGSTADPLIVSYVILGSATNGVDYEHLSGTVTIAAGAASADLEIVPTSDLDVEGPESVIVWIQAQPQYEVGLPSIASLSIADNVIVTITAPDQSASEVTLDTATFVISRAGGDLTAPLDVFVEVGGAANRLVRNDAALSNVIAGSMLTIPAGAASTTVTVTPFRDNLVEGDEDVTLTLRTNPNYVPGAETRASILIADDPPLVTIEATDALASESGLDPAMFTFTRSGGDLTQSLTVFCSFAGSTALNSIDFNATGCDAVIAANQTTGTLSIIPRVDGRIEGDESVIATLVGSTGNTYVIGAPATAVITISD